MPRRPCQLTQTDIRRAIAAARQAGAVSVELYQGAIVIRLDSPPIAPDTPVDAFTAWEREHESAKAAGRRERI
jgi:hypothetical protein